MGYKNTREHLPQIARELQADDIVEGSIVRDGDEVRVTVQLLDAPNDRHLWSEEYQRPLGSILTLQKEIAQSIAQQVRVTLNPQQQAQLGPAPAVAPRAYEAYLRGRYNLNLLFARHQPLDPAKEYFEESIRKDPGFAPAYAGLADTDINIAFTQHRWSPDIYRSAMQAAQKALQLDDHNGEAHATLAMLKWNFDWDWAGAERELQYAIAVDPSYDCARDYHASLLAWEGRRNEALAEVKRARELNAGSSFATTESSIYFQMRDFPGLIEVTRKAVISEPDDWVEQYFLGIGYEGSGRWSEAVAQYQKAVAMSGGDRDPTSALVHAYAVLGRRPQAEKLLLALQHSAKDEPISPYFLAVIFAGFGEKDKALGLLEEAQREKSVELMWSVRADPRIDSLRSDERFQAMLRRCNFHQMIVVLSQ
jgi:Flp pilus assembly protein TadD